MLSRPDLLAQSAATHNTVPSVVHSPTSHRRGQTFTLLPGAARQADSVQVRLIAEGSGGRSLRSSP
jgi:hypothetical protein